MLACRLQKLFHFVIFLTILGLPHPTLGMPCRPLLHPQADGGSGGASTPAQLRATYTHTNLIAADWRRLSKFYQEVFGCVPVPPARSHSGQWLTDGTGVPNASVAGEHLLLPGFGKNGPTLEIFQYSKNEDNYPPAANRLGYGHLAFAVENVSKAVDVVVKNGGKSHGRIVTRQVDGVGKLTFTYVQDPEGNLIELQNWEK